jgi:hypothetical protein
MRWREEVTLTTYEMNWTVSYFRHMCNKWLIVPGNERNASASSAGIYPVGAGVYQSNAGGSSNHPNTATTGPGNFAGIPRVSSRQANYSAGEFAYARKKLDIWEDITKKADRIFRSANSAYQSPL